MGQDSFDYPIALHSWHNNKNLNHYQHTSQTTLLILSASLPSVSSATSLPDVFKRVENSVVQITSTRSDPNQVIIINGVPVSGKSTALGSGFVYDKQGDIITNYHVVANATNADVTFTDGNTYLQKL